MPTSAFDCIALDALRDHPAVQPLILAELDRGVSFRILRFPLALHKPQRGVIKEARYVVTLQSSRQSPARVHSIFPERVEIKQERTSEVSIEPTLKIGAALEISGARLGRRIVTKQTQSAIIGYWSENGAEWRISALGDNQGLDGTWDFLAVVRWQKAVSPLRVNLAVSATVGIPHLGISWRTRRIERIYDEVRITGCTPIA